ncbi:MAG: ATP-binding cassette domain-containing protein [Dehalococcoidia bacterium]|nr:ATP-binding cassette domain-containing protein [Dehalococcoidia bacterium]
MSTDSKALEIKNVSKRFGEVEAARDVSFAVERGEIFGLIGPNGAGKTTIIRMLMEIIKADSGEIRILGEPLRESTKNKIGYLPEERGLYKKLTVIETLLYLSSLKGKTGDATRQRTTSLLQATGMLAHQHKKVEELSKGMAQLIQFVATILHDPELVILDEPFYGLDPVNTRMLKDMVGELRKQGKTIILSTHMMNEVEELCDRILMIDKGRSVLYGSLSEIKSRHRTDSVLLSVDGALGQIEGIVSMKNHGTHYQLLLDKQMSPQTLLASLVGRNITINRFEVATPSLSEIFVQVVTGQRT